MKIARWLAAGVPADGFVIGDRVVPFPDGRTVADMLSAGLDTVRELASRIGGDRGEPLAAVMLRSPLDPVSVRDFVAFEEHVEGVSASVDGAGGVVPEWYEAPTFYFANPHTVRATGETVIPPRTERLDFELEVAAVVGAVPGSNGTEVTRAEATSHIFGYTIMNDWSARDLQAREMRVRLGPCKGKDFAMTLGPWIVTADELERFHDEDGFLALRAEAWVNGELIGEDLLSNMGWTFGDLVAYAALDSRVAPGDVLGSGTVGNGGCLGELWGRNGRLSPPPLRTGDEVRLRVEGIGEIVNTVGAPRPGELPRPARPASRRRRRESEPARHS